MILTKINGHPHCPLLHLSEENMSLGENIYYYRTKLNQSQSDLADLLAVSRQSVSKWENDSAVPDLDKLIKMSSVFGVTLDALVFGHPTEESSPPAVEEPPPPAQTIQPSATVILPTKRSIIGCIMLIFGMTFFLLSIFWGNHLYFGEAFGEFMSIIIVLLSVMVLGFDRFSVLSICAVIYFIYCVISYGSLHVSSIWNYLFILASGVVILVWFILLGLSKTRGIIFREKTFEDLDEPTSTEEALPNEKEST